MHCECLCTRCVYFNNMKTEKIALNRYFYVCRKIGTCERNGNSCATFVK